MTIYGDDFHRENMYEEYRSLAWECLYSAQQSKDLAIDTAEILVEQGEQIKRIANNVEKVDEQVKKSEKKLRTISSIFGNVINFFANAINIKDENEIKEEVSVSVLEPEQEKIHEEDPLNELSSTLSDLKQIALNFGKELDSHNQLLDSLEGNLNRTTFRIEKATKQAQSLSV